MSVPHIKVQQLKVSQKSQSPFQVVNAVRKSGSDKQIESQHYLTAIKSEPETVLLNSKTPNKQSKLLAESIKSQEFLEEP
jgi:hypothetical protein